MLYFYFGDDQPRARAKFAKTVSSTLAKDPAASLFRFEVENFDVEKFKELLGARALFKEKVLVACDHVADLISGYEQATGESENIFFFLETKPNETLGKYAAKAEEFKLEKKEEKPEFNIWSVTNALERHDRQRLWVAIQKAYLAGVAPERIFWLLQWKAKDLGMKETHSRLTSLWHDAHFGITELDLGLEKLALSL